MRSNHIWAVIILVAIVASFVVGNQESADRDSDQRVQLIAGCDRSSERSILDAAYKQTTSDVRRETSVKKGDHDWQAAEKYQKFALGGASLVPLPASIVKQMENGKVLPRKALIGAVTESKDAAGEIIYRLTPQARAVLHQGCVEAYS